MDITTKGLMWETAVGVEFPLSLLFVLLCISIVFLKAKSKANRQSRLGARAFPLGKELMQSSTPHSFPC